MENAEKLTLIQTAVEVIDKLLKMSTGLSAMDRKIVAYCVLATHTLPFTSTFPLLVLIGPMGTGKSQTVRIVKKFSYKSQSLTPRG